VVDRPGALVNPLEAVSKSEKRVVRRYADRHAQAWPLLLLALPFVFLLIPRYTQPA